MRPRLPQRRLHLRLPRRREPAGRGAGRGRAASPSSARDGEQPDATADRPHELRRRSCPRRAQQCLRQCAARDQRGRDRAARARRRGSRRRSACADVRRQQERVDSAGRSARQRRRRYGRVAPLTDLVVDLYVPGELGIGASPVTTHNGASQTSYVSASGNHVGAASLPVERESGAWLLLARVEVAATPDTRVVVAFGDSITDGARSTREHERALARHACAPARRAAPRTESRRY